MNKGIVIKKSLLILAFSSVINAFAGGIDEVELALAATEGTIVYYTCIATPPVSVDQQAVCLALYTKYVATITAINAPYPLVPSIDADPYAWSPYDICRYEVGHIVFGNQVTIPYCPTL